MRWMETAWAQVGVSETPGESATPDIVRYFVDVGRPDVVSDEVPWCAGFVGACLARSGISLDRIPRDERLLARSYLKLGQPIEDLRVGAIVVLRRPSGGPGAGHVGFVAGWDQERVRVLGGNQSNSVNVAARSRADIVGLRWPDDGITPDMLAHEGSRVIQSAMRQQRDGAKAGISTVSAPAIPDMPQAAGAGIGDIAGKAGALKSALTTLGDFATFASSKWPYIAGALVAYWLGRMAYDAWLIKEARTSDAITGAHTGRTVQPREAVTDGFTL